MIYKPSAYLTEEEPAPRWLIPNVLHRGDQILYCGLQGTGKSFFLQYLTLKCAAGQPAVDEAVPPFRVLYFDEENGAHNWRAYARWLWRGMGRPSIALLDEHIRFASFTLMSANDWAERLLEVATAWPPDLMVIDTATPACHIKNENDNGEASLASTRIRRAQTAGDRDSACIIAKHLREALDKDGKPTRQYDVRGAKAWKGSCDSIWFHLKASGPKRADGFRNTYIRSEKGRAYGLQHDILISPTIRRGEFAKLDLTFCKPTD